MTKSRHPLRSIWSGIKLRCLNPRARNYAAYGGRGIIVCDKWKNSFEAFVADVGDRPSPKHSLDRIDNERGYEPGNVRWATQKEQARNARHNIWLTYNGRTMLMTEWADELGVSRQTMSHRYHKGLTGEQLFAAKPPLLEFDGRRLTVAQWARETGLKRTCIHRRLKIGLPLAEVLAPGRRPRRKAA